MNIKSVIEQKSLEKDKFLDEHKSNQESHESETEAIF